MESLEFEFGIITDGNNKDRVDRVVESIHALGIEENYGITVVGNYIPSNHHRIQVFRFDENQKSKWITKKKNLVTKYARFQNVVYMHDYICLNGDWWAGWKNHHKQYGMDFAVAMNRIINLDGSRYRDWTLCPCNTLENVRNAHNIPTSKNLLPYEEAGMSKGQYFSGAYWVAKKKVMVEFPLDESLGWGDGEDMIWSHQVRNKYDFVMNPQSSVRITVQNKHRAFDEISREDLENMKKHIAVNGIGTGYGTCPPHVPVHCETSFL